MQDAQKPLVTAIGKTLGAEFNQHDTELAALRQQVAELQERLERAVPANRTLKVVRQDEGYEPGALIG